MPAEWYVFLHGGFMRMSEWESTECERAVAEGKDVVVYAWGYKNNKGETEFHEYELDLVRMTQTNKTISAHTSRRLLRFCDSTDNRVLSPFYHG